jgi:hypothetical protein
LGPALLEVRRWLVLFQTRKDSFKVGECLGELPLHACRLVMEVGDPNEHPRALLQRERDRPQRR